MAAGAAGDEPYGYLFVHFREDPNGYAEKVYFDLSEGDDPLRWRPLNGGEAVLASDQGTKGVRDTYVVRNPHTGVIYILATDLRVYPCEGEPDWLGMHINTSTYINVWESRDLVHWSDMRRIDVSVGAEDKRFGIAWAPEALWVDDFEGTGEGRFVFYWAATFGASGEDVTAYDRATMYPRMVWGTTTDFTQESYRFGGVMIDDGAETIDTTMFQRELPDGSLRTYRLTKQNGSGKGNGIFEERIDRADWWNAPQSEWTFMRHHIGDGFAHGLGNPDPGCAEGPEVLRDNHSGRHYLFVDVLGVADTGYRAMIADDVDEGVASAEDAVSGVADQTQARLSGAAEHVDEICRLGGWRPVPDAECHLGALAKHGGFLNLTRAEYDRLAAADRDGTLPRA